MREFKRDLDVARVVASRKDWQDHVFECVASLSADSRRIRTASNLKHINWDVFNLNDYLFTHCTIVSSVCHDEDGHTITEGSAPIINANNNAWLNEVLGPPTNAYKSFIGAENYVEHVQVPYLSKGKILDAAIRKVRNASGENVFYVDILIATNRVHRDLIARIENGNLTTLSMGCVANVTQCSRCGKVINNDSETCNHLRYEAGQPYTTDFGYQSRTAELCGRVGQSDGIKFIEASWVENPAFKGAVINHYITGSRAVQAAIEEASSLIRLADYSIDLNNISERDVDVLKHVRVADRRGMTSLRLLVSAIEERLAETRVQRVADRLFTERD